MGLTRMAFKEYVWPRNPETLTVARRKNVGSYRIPHAGDTLQDLGGGSRAVSGAGVFTGPGCAEEFRKLAAAFSAEGPGPLLLPGMEPLSAVFSSLTRKEGTRPDCVAYEFTFLEDGAAPDAVSVVSEHGTRVCGPQDTLFSLAAECGSDVDALSALNPTIEWPNDPGEGTEVVLP